jgi:hypothetical protein
MNKKKKIWIGVISLVLALLLFMVLMVIQQSMQAKPESKCVLFAKEGIPQSVVLTEENIPTYTEEKEIPVMWLPEGYISSTEQLKGMISSVKIAKGSILNQEEFIVYDDYYAGYQELSWISVPIKELYEGVAGSLRTGDYIDIYLVKEEDKQYFCEVLEERVPIAAAYSNQGTVIGGDSTNGLTQLIVIPIEKQNVAQFYERLAQGNIRIAKYEAE